MTDSRPPSVPADLLRPSLQEHDRPHVDPARLPWRMGSQFWVAFFGGAIAVGIIAYLNAKRLGLSRTRRRWIVAATIAAFLLSVAVIVYFVVNPVSSDLRVLVRRTSQVVSVLLYLVLAWIQRPADRRHQLFDGAYASLWKPGFLAAAVSVLLTIAFVVGARSIAMGLR